MTSEKVPSKSADATGSQSLDFGSLVQELAKLASAPLGGVSDVSDEFRALYDCWVKAGGYIRGKPRRSVRNIKSWLGDSREVRSLETKLAGKTLLQRSDIVHLLDLFLERWCYEPKSDDDRAYVSSTKARVALVDKFTAEILERAGGNLRLPIRTRLGSSTKKLEETNANHSKDDSLPTRQTLIQNYRDSDALITVSRQSTFIGANPSSIMLGFQSLMDDLRKVDEEDGRFRALIWIVDLGRREGDASAQAAFYNMDFVATQFRALQLTRHSEQTKRGRWFRKRSVVLVGTLQYKEIDAHYAEVHLKPEFPNEDRSWVAVDRMLFEGIPHPWVPVIAKRGIDTMEQQSITVHCNRQRRQERNLHGDQGDDIDFLLHFPDRRADGLSSARCIGLPQLGVRWNDAFRMAHDVALLRLLGNEEKSDLPYTPLECLALLRRQHFAVFTAEEFCHFANRLAFKI